MNAGVKKSISLLLVGFREVHTEYTIKKIIKYKEISIPQIINANFCRKTLALGHTVSMFMKRRWK
ncbi:hypothetical protein D5663_07480 [Enterococcus faecalis]|nr:hypothetical protein [Enterococcus faecalis]EGO8962063.1 hypothetical protein [Enterococcus faecalis]EGO9253304.1 hypothetical protein [Enterococcus faecalis]PQF66803.1 hypothetical protein CUS74_00680 [Enterococcus faecalis]PQF95681.1 hypothetical protein CUS47_02650 [Enterococcus faecalis]